MLVNGVIINYRPHGYQTLLAFWLTFIYYNISPPSFQCTTDVANFNIRIQLYNDTSVLLQNQSLSPHLGLNFKVFALPSPGFFLIPNCH